MKWALVVIVMAGPSTPPTATTEGYYETTGDCYADFDAVDDKYKRQGEPHAQPVCVHSPEVYNAVP